MQRRIRTTKKLAQRINLNYFKRSAPLRQWRFWLAVALPLAGVAWVTWLGATGDKAIYSSGPVAKPHAVFGQQCGACHLVQAGVFRQHVADQACLDCHDGPIHQARQTFTPTCGSCHVEHIGAERLAAASDQACTQCHASLQVKGGVTKFDRNITGLNARHPEFAPLRQGQKDPGTIKLNHAVHMKPGLRGPRGNVNLECYDCHRPPAAKDAWPYAEGELKTVAEKQNEGFSPAPPTSAYMLPVKYAQSCAACHLLQFDKRFAEVVPHDKPEVVREYVVKKFREYLAKNPGEWRRVEMPERRLPGRPMSVAQAARSPEEWIQLRVADAERLLWGKTCAECHKLTYPKGPEALPEVAKPAITIVWMPNAKFDHQPHRMLNCTACHAATKSEKTEDILLPGVTNCQQCHAQGAGAEGRCFECHTYHDWTKKQRTKGKYQIEELLRRAGTGHVTATGTAGATPR